MVRAQAWPPRKSAVMDMRKLLLGATPGLALGYILLTGLLLSRVRPVPIIAFSAVPAADVATREPAAV